MRKYASDTLFINKVINKFRYLNRKLGNHRYSIVAFIAGGCIELCMVKIQSNGANFYKTFVEKQSVIEAEKRFFKERNKEIVEELMKNTPQEALDSLEFKNFEEEVQKQIRILEQRAKEEKEKIKAEKT